MAEIEKLYEKERLEGSEIAIIEFLGDNVMVSENIIVSRNWYEVNDVAGFYEYCNGKKIKCGCAGSETLCRHREYFNKSRGTCKRLREDVLAMMGVK